jgi:hypothetical protein
MIEASDKALHLGKRSAPHGEAQRSTWGSAALHMGEQEHGIHGSPMDFHGWRPAVAVALGGSGSAVPGGSDGTALETTWTIGRS